MSTSTDADRPALGNRDDWWGEDRDGSDDQEPTAGHDTRMEGRPPGYEEDLAEWKAHQILKHDAELVCPIAKFSPPDRGLEPLFAWLFDGDHLAHDPGALHHEHCEHPVTDPVVRPPKIHDRGDGRFLAYRQERRRCRLNSETGYVSGPYICDQSLPGFMESVRDWLGFVSISKGLSEREVDELRRDARRMKQQGDRRDVDILKVLIRDIISPEPILD